MDVRRFIKKHFKRSILVFFIMFLVLFSSSNIVRADDKIVASSTKELSSDNLINIVSYDEDVTLESDDGDTDLSNIITIGVAAGGEDMASVLQMLAVLTVIALAPSILIMLTSFTRVIIVLHFTRAALGTQTAPPNQILIGLALFLTFFIMAPTLNRVYTDSIKPLSEGTISSETAFELGMSPIREFMFKQTNTKDIRLFMDIAGMDYVENETEIPNTVIIPSFIVSELRTAFIIGFLIYIPFIVIDMVVASTLMAMGMMMLPPTIISLPFKILLFVMADGWSLVIGNLVKTFYH